MSDTNEFDRFCTPSKPLGDTSLMAVEIKRLERENTALREQLITVTSELTVTKANALADRERLEADNDALRSAAAIEEERSLYWRAAEEKLKRENGALRERLDSLANTQADQTAELRNKIAMYEGQTRFLCQCGGTKP